MKHGTQHHIAAGLVVGLLFAFLVYPSTKAEEQPVNEGITLSPVSKHYTFEPGTIKDDTLLVLNHGKTDYDINLLTSNYSVIGEEYATNSDNSKDPMADVGNWVTFEQKTYHLKAGENVTVPYRVTVPQKVTPGAHTGAVMVEIQPKSDQGIVTRKRVGLILYTNVGGGDTKPSGLAESASIPFYQ